MIYELKKGVSTGILIDKTPILGDVRDTSFEVSFSFIDEQGNEYEPNAVALIKCYDEHKEYAEIKNGKLVIPFSVIQKRKRTYRLTVFEIGESKFVEDNFSIIQTWQCPPFKISSMYDAEESMVQLICGLSDAEWLTLLEQVGRDNETILNTLASIQTQIQSYKENMSTLTEDFKQLADKHNTLVVEFEKFKEEV